MIFQAKTDNYGRTRRTVRFMVDAKKELEKVKGENPVSQKMFRAI